MQHLDHDVLKNYWLGWIDYCRQLSTLVDNMTKYVNSAGEYTHVFRPTLMIAASSLDTNKDLLGIQKEEDIPTSPDLTVSLGFRNDLEKLLEHMNKEALND